jgi:hypothetical protein
MRAHGRTPALRKNPEIIPTTVTLLLLQYQTFIMLNTAVTVGSALRGLLHPPGSLLAQMLKTAGAVVGVQAIGPGIFFKEKPPARQVWPTPLITSCAGAESDGPKTQHNAI